MSQSVVDKWRECKPGSLGLVLFETLTRWQKKVLPEKKDNGRVRFVSWVREMQMRGMFGDCESAPPKPSDFSMFLNLVTGSRDQARATVHDAGIRHSGKAEREEKELKHF